MNRKNGVRLLTINIREFPSGLYVATSDEEPEFYLSDPSREKLERLIACALEHMYSLRGEPSVVLPAEDHNDPLKYPFAMIPKSLLAHREEYC